MSELDEILGLAAERRASDVHLQAGPPPILRILTRLVPLEAATLDVAATERLIFSIMTEEQQTRVRERREVDISYALPEVARFRINVFRQRDSVTAAFRRIPYDVPSPESLGLPRGVVELATLRRGLVLFTGAAGQGKSTTLAALIEVINRAGPAGAGAPHGPLLERAPALGTARGGRHGLAPRPYSQHHQGRADQESQGLLPPEPRRRAQAEGIGEE